jgi:hypothetical protein
MIARSWRATATPDGARRYEEHFHIAVLPKLQAAVVDLAAQAALSNFDTTVDHYEAEQHHA